ncbi:MAG: glycosyltransferase family 2 protein [Woeseiaceae bacterium]
MDLSIIIVNYRSWGHLQTALDALLPGFPFDEWEIIVVDNESDPDLFDEFSRKFPEIIFTANPVNSGFAFGANLGAARATGEFLIFMNPDVIANVGDIVALIEERKRLGEVALLTPRQVDSKGRTQKLYDAFPDLLNHFRTVKGLLRFLKPDKYPNPRADIKTVIYPDWVGCSFLLISRKDFDTIGGWSEDYWLYAEDTDLCRRARDEGLRAACTPTVTVVHTHGGSSRHSESVTALSKLEVVISKNVFAQAHSKGMRRVLNHLIIALLNLPVLSLAALLNIVTLRSVRALRLRAYIFSELTPYYWNALKTGVWLSPRALANKSANPS